VFDASMGAASAFAASLAEAASLAVPVVPLQATPAIERPKAI